MPLTLDQQWTHAQLEQLAAPLVAACPDMRQLARQTAQAILAKHGQAQRDPDQVYLNRFDAAQSSPRTFSGWTHHDAPVQSFTLPQLVMHRFDVHDQDNADLLGYLTGFYSQGSEQTVFDEHNEIPISPQAVLEDFWVIDFSGQFHQKLDAFWHGHADDYRTLAKVTFLGAVLEACEVDANSELARCARHVAAVFTGTDNWPPTLAQIHQQVPAPAGYHVRTLDIGGHQASDILRFCMPDGRQLLYIPGEEQTLFLFNNDQALYQWVLLSTNHSGNRARFMTHFPLASQQDEGSRVGLNHMIDLLFFSWGSERHAALNQLDSALAGDAFTALRDRARQRMYDDARLALRSNSDLRKQLWIGYLGAFAQVVSPMVAVDWPIALAAVGAGLAQVGLQIDQAITGRTTAEREAGVIGAVLAAINTLFDAAALGAQLDSAAGELVAAVTADEPAIARLAAQSDTTPATVAEVEEWVPESLRHVQRNELLEPLQANVVLESEPGSGALRGIHTQDGKFYALVDEVPYQVRRVEQLQTWVIVDPANPYSFYRNVPLRWEEGQWHPVERPGLAGGGLPRAWLKLWGKVWPAPSSVELPLTPYEVPLALRAELRRTALSGDLRPLSGAYGDLSPEVEAMYDQFRELRDRLAADAATFIEQNALPPRPELPELPTHASPKQLIRAVYARSHGLVVGEGHSQLGSKRLLIDNMAQLRKAGVKVLYLEHYMTDFQQVELTHFTRTGRMSAELKRYVAEQDFGHATDRSGAYTFEKVMQAAQEQGVRLQAIDCMASYRQAWAEAPPAQARQKMMNYFAHLIIDADQAAHGPSKWVALVGNSHSNTFQGVPGIAELQGVIGLRVEDLAQGMLGGISIDPGLTAIDRDLSLLPIRADLRLQVAIDADGIVIDNPEIGLPNKGDFTFRMQDDKPQLLHRSSDGQIKVTPIQTHGAYLQIDRPDWPWISGRHLRDLAEMRAALTRNGLTYKRL